jgi:hypothetical protein
VRRVALSRETAERCEGIMTCLEARTGTFGITPR